MRGLAMLVLAFAAAPSQAQKPMNAPPSALSDVDAALRRASEESASAERCFAGADLGDRREGLANAAFCAPGFELDKLGGPLALPRGIYPAYRFDESLACLAFAKNDIALCETLDSETAGLRDDIRRSCRTSFFFAKLAKAAISGAPPLNGVCAEIRGLGAEGDDDFFKLCGDVAASRADPAAVCAALKKRMSSLNAGKPKAKQEVYSEATCRNVIAALSGHGDCASLNDRDDRRQCEAARGLRDGACGGSGLCLAMKGEGESACRGFAAQARADFCRRETCLGLYSNARASLDQALGILRNLAEGQPGLSERAKSAHALEERLTRLTPKTLREP